MMAMKKKRGSGTAIKLKGMIITTLILAAFVASASAATLTITPPDATVGDDITITGTGFESNENVTVKTTVTCYKPVVDGKCQCTMEDFEIRQGVLFSLSVEEVTDNVTIYIKKSILPWWTVTPGFPGFTFVYSPNTSTVSSVEVPVGGMYKIDVIGNAVEGSENCTMITTAEFKVTADGTGNFSDTFDTQGIPICKFNINATGEISGSAEDQLNLSLLGDPSKDGQVNVYDCCCIARYVVGISGYDNGTICYNAAAGIAPPCGGVTIEDARYLARYLIGKESSIPHGTCGP